MTVSVCVSVHLYVCVSGFLCVSVCLYVCVSVCVCCVVCMFKSLYVYNFANVA